MQDAQFEGDPLWGRSVERNRQALWLPALAAKLLLTACVTGSSSPSSPGPQLSAACERLYQSYSSEAAPRYFATDFTGRVCGYVYCPRAGQTDCRRAYPSDAIRTCERNTNGADCYIYAVGRSRDWQGPGN